MTACCTWRYSRQLALFRYGKRMVRKPRIKLWIVQMTITELPSSLNVKYGTGKSGCISTENLYRSPIATATTVKFWLPWVRTWAWFFVKSPNLSECICNPFAWKIRNLCKLFAEIKNMVSQDEAKVEQVIVSRSKRQLPTPVSTPNQSPCKQ